MDSYHSIEAAQEAGEQLRQRLPGKGWRVQVWLERDIWKFWLYNEGITVIQHGPLGHSDTYYGVLLAADKQVGASEGVWNLMLTPKERQGWVESQFDPAKAVRYAVAMANRASKRLAKLTQRWRKLTTTKRGSHARHP